MDMEKSSYERWDDKDFVKATGGCAYYALVASLEAILRVKSGRDISLSINHLIKLDEDSRTRLPTEAGKIRRLLLMIKDDGIFEEGQYNDILEGTLRDTDARRYKISKFYAYDVNKTDSIKHALYKLRSTGPLVAVIKISKNYHDCKTSGLIYRFDSSRPVLNKFRVEETHAVSVVSFAIESRVPCLECQDSHGPGFGRKGFLVVDMTSVVELYSIVI